MRRLRPSPSRPGRRTIARAARRHRPAVQGRPGRGYSGGARCRAPGGRCGIRQGRRGHDPHQIADLAEARARAGARRRDAVIRCVHADRIPHSVARHSWPRLLRRGARGDRRQGQRAAAGGRPTLAEVSDAEIARHFAPLPRGEWRLPNPDRPRCSRSAAAAANAIAARSGTHSSRCMPRSRQVNDGALDRRLVIFLRVMAVLSMAKGLYHWAMVCGIAGPRGRLRVSADAVADRDGVLCGDRSRGGGRALARRGLGRGGVAHRRVSMAAVEVFFPQVYGGRLSVVGDRGRAAVRLSGPRHPIGARASAIEICTKSIGELRMNRRGESSRNRSLGSRASSALAPAGR